MRVLRDKARRAKANRAQIGHADGTHKGGVQGSRAPRSRGSSVPETLTLVLSFPAAYHREHPLHNLQAVPRQCPDQPLRSGTSGSEANQNFGAAGDGGRPT
jgi:hypothetical protein